MNKLNVSIKDNGIGTCLYCKKAIDKPIYYSKLNNNYHASCHEQVSKYTKITLELEKIALELELNEARALRAEEYSIKARKRAETIAYNKEHQIERINHITYYQFLDEYNCVIFVCYDTIVGVLHDHKFFTVENNFSITTDRQIKNILPYGGMPKIERASYGKGTDNEVFYDKTVYTNHTEVPIREFERILSNIGISHLQRIGEGTSGNYYYHNRSYPSGTWISVCEVGWTSNEAANKLENWIKSNLDFNKDRYDIYLRAGSREMTMKIWDRKLMKYKTLLYSRRKWNPENKKKYPVTEIWKYGFRPLKKLLLKQRGFKEI